ncbi:MAG TPA: glucosaminidase domain-containing protein [Burkholderiales bacterium]|nr:glucosaminidase domain-containing protein [Burkholderiales bacterium]
MNILVPAMSIWNAAFVALALCLPAASAAGAAWPCNGTKPGHPTPAEREAFIREVSALAVQAEKTHGVPASALAAIAIAESGYGWTRLALEANNLFAWRWRPVTSAGRKSYVLECRQSGVEPDRYMVFASREDAVDFVARRFTTANIYREHTQAYQAARERGDTAERAVKAWVSGVARHYSRPPEVFRRKITRIMNNPAAPGDTVSREANLYRLSASAGSAR